MFAMNGMNIRQDNKQENATDVSIFVLEQVERNEELKS